MERISVKIIAFSAVAFTTFFLTSCYIPIKPVSEKDQLTRVRTDWRNMFLAQPKVTRPISMYQAIARALKYNLDIRLKTLESVLGKSQWRLASYDMLPEVAASAGYVTRDNVNAARTVNLNNPGAPSTVGTSQDQTRDIADLQGSWNVIDFGISYIEAKQNGDQYMITLQRRRKMIQNVERDVRYAYWRAASAQILQNKLTRLSREVNDAIKRSNEIAESHLRPALAMLRYQKSLYEIMRYIRVLQRNLIQAHSELAALMDIPPGEKFTLIIPKKYRRPLPKGFPMRRRVLEKIALLDRPELREEEYRKRIAIADVEKARLKMFPAFEILGGTNYDSNSFLLNNGWANLGLQMSWNLLSLFRTPQAIHSAKANLQIANMRRMALSMAVITQVDIAYYRYHQALRDLEVSWKLKVVDHKIYKQIESQHNANHGDNLELIRSQANSILASLRSDLDYAEWQNAGGQLLSTIGDDSIPLINIKDKLPTLTAIVRRSLNRAPSLKKLTALFKQLPPPEKDGQSGIPSPAYTNTLYKHKMAELARWMKRNKLAAIKHRTKIVKIKPAAINKKLLRDLTGEHVKHKLAKVKRQQHHKKPQHASVTFQRVNQKSNAFEDEIIRIATNPVG